MIIRIWATNINKFIFVQQQCLSYCNPIQQTHGKRTSNVTACEFAGPNANPLLIEVSGQIVRCYNATRWKLDFWLCIVPRYMPSLGSNKTKILSHSFPAISVMESDYVHNVFTATQTKTICTSSSGLDEFVNTIDRRLLLLLCGDGKCPHCNQGCSVAADSCRQVSHLKSLVLIPVLLRHNPDHQSISWMSLVVQEFRSCKANTEWYFNRVNGAKLKLWSMILYTSMSNAHGTA